MTWRGWIISAFLAAGWAVPAWAGDNRLLVIRIEGAIGPATADYVSRAVDEAAERHAQCLVVEIDTPGGLLDSTKHIVQKFLGSPVPTVVYVTPAGATATSAGCFITLAADVAVMAPTTAIGAAHPVSSGGEPLDDVMKKKLENYAVSYIESIAAKRKRNVEWAKSSVAESASITADKALELHVIDFIARDMDDLIKQLNGRTVNGHKLDLSGVQVVRVSMSWREQFFQMVWRPEVMFILMLIAIYGLIGELSNPGAILPGVGGAIAFILVLYMSSILPINIAGVALIVLAIALFVIDVFSPTHGVLTGGGIIAFFLGALMMFDTAEGAYRLSLGLIVPATALTGAFFLFAVGAGLRAQRLSHKTGAESMLGKMAIAAGAVDLRGGWVTIEGESWNAISDTPIRQGQAVEVLAIEGLTLKVRPKI